MTRTIRCCAMIAATAALVACATVPPLTRPQESAPPAIDVPVIARPAGETPQWWFRAGAAAAHAARGDHAGQAKNVIVFLGDGMSIGTIAAARVLEGQRRNASGEEQRLSFEELPYTALSRTYEVDAQTPDSAGTMTAIMSGVKTRYRMIGVDQRARRGDCASSRGNELVSALELAGAAGMATGVVTTTRITHATPAATYAHTPDRQWEYDAAIPPAERAAGCTDIARQLVDFPIAGGIDVMFGGGRSGFQPTTQADIEYPQRRGKRADGRDLIAEWQRRPGSTFIWNAEQFAALDPAAGARVLGLFEPEHMNYENERATDGAGEPSLADMTRTAIATLQRNPRGYFLMVEGGRIDHAHHAGNAFRALNETIAFSDAVRVATEATSSADTLIIVTSDHSHTMTFAGTPARGNPILGKLRGPAPDGASSSDLARDETGRTYTTLGYANGPGYAGASDAQAEGPKRFPHRPTRIEPARNGRVNIDDIDTEDADYLQESAVPLTSETHSGEDVAVFARGPGAEGVHGSLEQNVLFHLIAQANPAIRAQLCALKSCNADGVPVDLPDRQRLRQH